MENSTTEQVKLSKHLSAAVNAIQKEIDKKQLQIIRLINRSEEATHEAGELQKDIDGLEEQIAKLKAS